MSLIRQEDPVNYFLLWLYFSVEPHMEDCTVMQIPEDIKITETSSEPPFLWLLSQNVWCCLVSCHIARLIFTSKAHVFLLCTAVQESNLTVVLVVTVMKLHGNPSEDGTKHNVLDNAQPNSFRFFKWSNKTLFKIAAVRLFLAPISPR